MREPDRTEAQRQRSAQQSTERARVLDAVQREEELRPRGRRRRRGQRDAAHLPASAEKGSSVLAAEAWAPSFSDSVWQRKDTR